MLRPSLLLCDRVMVRLGHPSQGHTFPWGAETWGQKPGSFQKEEGATKV